MGCDIHFHSEVKINGTWHHYSQLRLERNYVLFAKMAGVRKHNGWDFDPISKPKGIPSDATFLTKFDVETWDGDGHSHSWLDANEIADLHNFINDDTNPVWYRLGYNFESDNFPCFLGDYLSGFIEDREKWERSGVEDVRYIFFFDN